MLSLFSTDCAPARSSPCHGWCMWKKKCKIGLARAWHNCLYMRMTWPCQDLWDVLLDFFGGLRQLQQHYFFLICLSMVTRNSHGQKPPCENFCFAFGENWTNYKISIWNLIEKIMVYHLYCFPELYSIFFYVWFSFCFLQS